MSSRQYPRVLLVNGEPISLVTPTGITMTNLFAGWPADLAARHPEITHIIHLAPKRVFDTRW